MEKYMKIALKEAKKAYKKGEIPVGAVVVYKEKIVARAYNTKENKKLSTAHAEIIAINKASRKLKNWRLNDCKLYVTLEPCMMCAGAIIQSRISTVVFGTKNNNSGYSTILKENGIEVIENIYQENCQKLLQQFFIEKRNQNL